LFRDDFVLRLLVCASRVWRWSSHWQTQDSQQELAGVLDLGMGGGRDVNVLDSLNSLGKMTIPFDAAPSDAVAPYLTLQCAAKVTTLSSSGTYLAASSCLYLLAACCSLLILSH